MILRFMLFLCLMAAAAASQSADATAPDVGEEPPIQPWVKRGIVVPPDIGGPGYGRYASGPSVVKLKNGRLRMYFWASVGLLPDKETNVFLAAEAAPGNPFQWELISHEPLLGPGQRGSVYEQGVALPFVIRRDDGPWLMYYSGLGSLNLEPGVTRSARTGLALSHDEGLTWHVENEVLLPLGRPGAYDAALTGSVAVLRGGENTYMMWYTAGERYESFGEHKRGIVHLGMARSHDGIAWQKLKAPALRARLDVVDPYEAVVSRPAVLKLHGVYHMWLNVFRMKGLGYRIEYAQSTDGVDWHRFADHPVLPLTAGDFDSKNQSYPCVIEMGNQLWMFYVGDDFGRTGIGLATIDKSALRAGSLLGSSSDQ